MSNKKTVTFACDYPFKIIVTAKKYLPSNTIINCANGSTAQLPDEDDILVYHDIPLNNVSFKCKDLICSTVLTTINFIGVNQTDTKLIEKNHHALIGYINDYLKNNLYKPIEMMFAEYDPNIFNYKDVRYSYKYNEQKSMCKLIEYDNIYIKFDTNVNANGIAAYLSDVHRMKDQKCNVTSIHLLSYESLFGLHETDFTRLNRIELFTDNDSQNAQELIRFTQITSLKLTTSEVICGGCYDSLTEQLFNISQALQSLTNLTSLNLCFSHLANSEYFPQLFDTIINSKSITSFKLTLKDKFVSPKSLQEKVYSLMTTNTTLTNLSIKIPKRFINKDPLFANLIEALTINTTLINFALKNRCIVVRDLKTLTDFLTAHQTTQYVNINCVILSFSREVLVNLIDQYPDSRILDNLIRSFDKYNDDNYECDDYEYND